MNVASFLDPLLGNRMSRLAIDAGFGWYARRRTENLDRMSVPECQRQVLLRLVRRAKGTRFGRDHDFRGIRTAADYQARVPLREYEDFLTEYWQVADAENVTWPGRVPYFALSSGTTAAATKRIPVSREMIASNRKAALTGLAWFRAAHSHLPLFDGRLFFLGGSTELAVHGTHGAMEGDLSGIVAREASAAMRPFTYPPVETALVRDWERKLTILAEESVKLPIIMISGVPSWLLVLFERLTQITGKKRIVDIWPMLRLVIHGGTSFEPYRRLFQQILGSEDVHYLETYPASEGFIAAEDARHGMLRLIPDHDVFFEFVPVGELDQVRPTRHTVGEIVPGIQYAVVVTTCAGLWSYVLGDTVCFESVSPPLLRFTGRTKQYLSAFGEHLIGEEVERAVACAAEATGASVTDFHVGPAFPEDAASPGRHRYLVEFVQPPTDLRHFTRILDETLCRSNEDYQAHRADDLTMRSPEVEIVSRGGFASWMKSRGKLGGQHKVPRLDNTGKTTAEIVKWMKSTASDSTNLAQMEKASS